MAGLGDILASMESNPSSFKKRELRPREGRDLPDISEQINDTCRAGLEANLFAPVSVVSSSRLRWQLSQTDMLTISGLASAGSNNKTQTNSSSVQIEPYSSLNFQTYGHTVDP